MNNQQHEATLRAIKAATERALTIPGYARCSLIAQGVYTLNGDQHERYGGPARPARRLRWESWPETGTRETFVARHGEHALMVRWAGTHIGTDSWDAFLDGRQIFLFDGEEPVQGFEATGFPDHIDAMLALERSLGLHPMGAAA